MGSQQPEADQLAPEVAPTPEALLRERDEFLAGLTPTSDPGVRRRYLLDAWWFQPIDASVPKRVAEVLSIPQDEMSLYMGLTRDGLRASLDWDTLGFLGRSGPPKPQGRPWSAYPTTGFIGDYLEWTLGSEAQLSFHFWSAVGTISCASRRTFWLSRGHYDLFASIPVVLVSYSGQGKTSACRIAGRLISNMPEANIIDSSVTPEMLVQVLRSPSTPTVQATDANGNLLLTAAISPDCHGFLTSEELGTLLKKKKYAEDLPTLLGNLFDCPPFHGDASKVSSRSRLTNVYLGMLSGITPHGLRTQIPESAHEEGFVSRVMWIYRPYSDRTIPDPPPPSAFLESRLRRHAQGLSAYPQPCEMKLDREASEFFNVWYLEHGKSIRNREDSRFTGYLARKHTFVLRLAMILALCEYPPRYGINLATLQLAKRIIDEEESHLETILAAIDTVPAVGDNLIRVRDVLYRLWAEGIPVPRSTLMRALSHRLTARQLDDIVGSLAIMGELRVEKEKSSTKPGTYYHRGKV